MLSKLEESFNQLASDDYVIQCTKLKKYFLKIRKVQSFSEKIDILIESLLVSSAYEERLVSMKLSCKSIRSKVNFIYEKKCNEIVTGEESFFKMKKCDQDRLIAAKTEKISEVMSKIDYKLEMIDDSLEYVRNASFNLKSILSTLKEYKDV